MEQRLESEGFRFNAYYPVYLAGLVAIGLTITSIAVWEAAGGTDERFRLILAGLAGALGGSLRSMAFVAAFRSMSAAERRQWQIELLIGLPLGAVAGLGAVLMTRAFLAGPDLNLHGQYLLSVYLGFVSLGAVSNYVEQRLVRSSLSRSGILGATPSINLSILDRIDRTIEARVSVDRRVNYRGYVEGRARQLDDSLWEIAVRFVGGEGVGEGRASGPEGWFGGPILVEGGHSAPYAPFTVSVVSEDFESSPLNLRVDAPTADASNTVNFFATLLDDGYDRSGQRGRPAGVLEVAQGGLVVQAVRVVLARDLDSDVL